MTRARVIQLAGLAVLLLCLSIASWMGRNIHQQRQTLQLGYLGDTLRPPPDAAISTVLAAGTGSFRGLAANILWYRANRLKEEGKYHEANQLAEFITTLQPHFPQVWYFHAWNMAYNISVATYTPQERWDWVSKGIALLRDKGIPANPRSVVLYKELGWIFFHKIGNTADDMHWYYKRQLAAEWQEILGAPAEGADVEKALEPIAQIAAAPDTLAALRKQTPTVDLLLEELATLGYQPDDNLLRQMGRVAMFQLSQDVKVLETGVRTQLADRFDQKLAQVMAQSKHVQALPALTLFLRKQILQKTYRMDPAFMIRLMTPKERGGFGFGPIDWRHPSSHSLYWTAMGTVIADQVINKKDIDLLNTYRSCIHSLQLLTDSGRVSYDPISGYLDLLPDPRFIPAYERAMNLALEDLKKNEYGGTTETLYQAGHENFLLKAIVFTYLYGSRDEAQRYYQELRQAYGNLPGRSTRYGSGLEQTVFDELRLNIELQAYTRQFVDAMFAQAFAQGLANNRPDVFDRQLQLAKMVHSMNQNRAVANPNAPQRRLAMLPFDQVLTESFKGFIEQSSYPLLIRARAWRNAPLPLRQRVYDRVKEPLTAQCKELGFNMAMAFPEPEGMNQLRESAPGPTPGKQTSDSPVQLEKK